MQDAPEEVLSTEEEQLPEAAQDAPVEEQIEEPVETEEPEEDPVEDTADVPEEEPKVSRREQLRIQQLLERMKTPKEEVTPTIPDGFIDYGEDLDADEQTVKRLKEDREAFGTRMFNQGLEQMRATEFRMQLNIDAPRVESKYPQLDKNSEQFNPVAARAINTMYLAAAGYDTQTGRVGNPELRYSDYVEGLFELADEIADRKVAEAQKTVRAQASKTAIRPNGAATKKLNLNKAPQDMTDEELTAYLNQYFPAR